MDRCAQRNQLDVTKLVSIHIPFTTEEFPAFGIFPLIQSFLLPITSDVEFVYPFFSKKYILQKVHF